MRGWPRGCKATGPAGCSRQRLTRFLQVRRHAWLLLLLQQWPAPPLESPRLSTRSPAVQGRAATGRTIAGDPALWPSSTPAPPCLAPQLGRNTQPGVPRLVCRNCPTTWRSRARAAKPQIKPQAALLTVCCTISSLNWPAMRQVLILAGQLSCGQRGTGLDKHRCAHVLFCGSCPDPQTSANCRLCSRDPQRRTLPLLLPAPPCNHSRLASAAAPQGRAPSLTTRCSQRPHRTPSAAP